jgi:hypothetical protein
MELACDTSHKIKFEAQPFPAFFISETNMWNPHNQSATYYYNLAQHTCVKALLRKQIKVP